MQSSSILVTLRALVMVVSLIAVPAWAVMGTALPAKLVAFFGGQGRTAAELRVDSTPTHKGLPEAPAFRPATLGPPAASATPATVVQASASIPLVGEAREMPPTAVARDNANQRPPQRNPFAGIENRLRELGATYYRLETWGENGELYHFQCQMTVEGPPGANRQFESTDRDAFQAMARVVQQVEEWRSGRVR